MKTAITFLAVAIIGTLLSISSGQTPPGHRFNGLSPSADQTFSLSLGGSVSSAFRPYFDIYLVEASTDLRDWTPLATLLRSNTSVNPLIYVDTATNYSRRFYRTPTNYLFTPLPQPMGPYAVGTTTRLLSDPTRTNRYKVKTNASFVVQFWYPAQRVAGVMPHAYEGKALAQDANWNPGFTAIVPLFVSHALPDTPLATNQARYPVILYSHGGGTVRTDNQGKMEELASHGFVVISADHFDAFGVVLPDGRYVHGDSRSASELGQAASQLSVKNRIEDMKCISDELGKLNEKDPLFTTRLQLDKIGVCGHSRGGAAAAEFARLDERVGAIAHLDGPVFYYATNLVQLPIGKPFLSMNRTDPANPLDGDSSAVFAKVAAEAYWLQIKETVHYDFMDFNWVEKPTASFRAASIAMRGCLASFFNKYLRDLDDHLLDNPTDRFPGITNFSRK